MQIVFRYWVVSLKCKKWCFVVGKYRWILRNSRIKNYKLIKMRARDSRRANVSSLVALNPSPMLTCDWPRFQISAIFKIRPIRWLSPPSPFLFSPRINSFWLYLRFVYTIYSSVFQVNLFQMEETDGSPVAMTEPVNERPKRNKRKSSMVDMDASPERNFKRSGSH